MREFLAKIDPKLKFIFIGGLTFVIDMSIFSTLLYFKLHYNIAVAISYIFAVAFHFLANKFLTFGNYEKSAGQVGRYLIWNAIYFVLTYALLNLFIYIGTPYEGLYGLTMNYIKVLSRGISAIILTIASYLVLKLVIFRTG